MGAFLAEIYVGRVQIKFKWLALLTFIVIPLLVTVEPFNLIQIDSDVAAVLWGLGFAGLFSTLFAWQNRGGSLHGLARLKPLGDMSYTLYITHQPIMTFISAWLIVQSPIGSLPRGFEWIAIGVAVCLAIAYVLHLFVEKPFQRRIMVLAANPHSA